MCGIATRRDDERSACNVRLHHLGQTQTRNFCGRDPFGIKPLYYSDNGHTVRLASQVKALRVGGGIDLAPDPAGHVGYFLWGHVPGPHTMFRSTRSLPAGHSLWIDRNGSGSH
jgi:asparagine synthase (glutamine-hydrolysing)